jgi:hypothetical protein
VRQPIADALEAEGSVMAITAKPVGQSKNNRWANTPGGRLYGVAPSSSNENLARLLPPTHGS